MTWTSCKLQFSQLRDNSIQVTSYPTTDLTLISLTATYSYKFTSLCSGKCLLCSKWLGTVCLLSDSSGKFWATDMVVERDRSGSMIYGALDQRLLLATVITEAGADTTVDILKTFLSRAILTCLLMVTDDDAFRLPYSGASNPLPTIDRRSTPHLTRWSTIHLVWV